MVKGERGWKEPERYIPDTLGVLAYLEFKAYPNLTVKCYTGVRGAFKGDDN